MVLRKAYAKINLGLRILSKREDGYHEIETIFHRVNVFDTLTFEENLQISVISSENTLPIDNTNLCMKAAIKVHNLYQVNQGVRITLDKNIPIGAGLGGGSSDAAATLIALNQLWKLSLDDAKLLSLAAHLGSDVPYFLKNGSAYATGRGEILEYFHLDIPYWIVLVYPNVHVSTAWAYGQCNTQRTTYKVRMRDTLLSNIHDINTIEQYLRNDFEELIFPEYPIIGEIKREMLHLGAVFAQMSGSGSAVYGFFTSEKFALNVLNEFGGTYRVFLTRPHFQPEE